MKQPWTLGSHSSMHKSKDVSEDYFKSKMWQSEISPSINSLMETRKPRKPKHSKKKVCMSVLIWGEKQQCRYN